MKTKRILIGEVVIMKGDDQVAMTVTGLVSADGVICAWFDQEKHIHYCVIPVAALAIVVPDPIPTR